MPLICAAAAAAVLHPLRWLPPLFQTLHHFTLCLLAPQIQPQCALTITDAQLLPQGCGSVDPEVSVEI
jgi:hypothetical protein